MQQRAEFRSRGTVFFRRLDLKFRETDVLLTTELPGPLRLADLTPAASYGYGVTGELSATADDTWRAHALQGHGLPIVVAPGGIWSPAGRVTFIPAADPPG